MKKFPTWLMVTLILVCVFCIGVRFQPYFHSSIPLGYDPGMYRGIFLAYQSFVASRDLSLLPQRVQQHEPLRWVVAVGLSKLGVSIDRLLTRWFAIICIAVSVLALLLLKKQPMSVKILAWTLLLLSVIQFETFELMYFKQVIGMGLMFLIFWCFDRQNLRAACVLMVGLALMHRNTTLYFALTLTIWTILTSIFSIIKAKDYKRRYRYLPLKVIWVWVVAAGIGLLFYGPRLGTLVLNFVQPLLTTTGGMGFQGTFFPVKDFLIFELVLLLPALYGIWIKMRNKDADFLVSGTLSWIIWTAGGLFNAKRTLIFFDIFLVLIAAYGLYYFYQKRQKRWIAAIIIVLSIQGLFFAGFIMEHAKPRIPQWLFQDAQELASHTKEGSTILVTDSVMLPWVAWYSHRDRIAPGFGDHNMWNYEQRMDRRLHDGTKKCQLITDYSQYFSSWFYLWIANQQRENFTSGSCFRPVQTLKESVLYQYTTE